MAQQNESQWRPSRRAFMGAAAGGLAAATLAGNHAQAQEPPPLRVGLIGCGKRGTGAARDCVSAAPNIEIAALGDVFSDQLAEGRKNLAQLGDAFTATDDTCFTGFDAYKRVLEQDVDVVILATPPGFRPEHLAAAVDAGKHVFMEKPVAVDPSGVRSILESSEKADDQGLAIVAGTQRRHQAQYLEILRRIHDGAVGEIVSAACYWIGNYNYYPAVPRQDGWSDMESHLRNWNYFTWLSGDHIVEQHVHNIDVMNWVLQAHPIKAVGMGGRQQRTGKEFGHIYDHFAVEYEYPGGVKVTSMCRQNKDTYQRVDEYVAGTKGTARPGSSIQGPNAYEFTGDAPNPYVQEHADLIASIREGTPLNEGKAIAESTLAAIMGRMSAYTGQEVTWDFAMNESKLDLSPEAYEFGPLPEPEVAIPGVTELI